MLKYWMYKIGQAVVNILPLCVSYRLAECLCDLHYRFSTVDRLAVESNLKKILPSTDNLQVETREVFRNFGRYLVEFLRMQKMLAPDFIEDKICINNLEHIDEALQKGKGVIILTAHIGNWEVGAALLSRLGFSLMAVALAHKAQPVNNLFNYQRESQGMTVIPTNIAIRRCLEQLKENKLVALVGDRDFGVKGQAMDFLGGKMIIPKGAAMFSYKTGAPIVPCFLIREKDFSFTLTVHEPMYPLANNTLPEEEAVTKIMRSFLPIIENEIKRHPNQWLMFREFQNA